MDNKKTAITITLAIIGIILVMNFNTTFSIIGAIRARDIFRGISEGKATFIYGEASGLQNPYSQLCVDISHSKIVIATDISRNWCDQNGGSCFVGSWSEEGNTMCEECSIQTSEIFDNWYVDEEESSCLVTMDRLGATCTNTPYIFDGDACTNSCEIEGRPSISCTLILQVTDPNRQSALQTKTVSITTNKKTLQPGETFTTETEMDITNIDTTKPIKLQYNIQAKTNQETIDRTYTFQNEE